MHVDEKDVKDMLMGLSDSNIDFEEDVELTNRSIVTEKQMSAQEKMVKTKAGRRKRQKYQSTKLKQR